MGKKRLGCYPVTVTVAVAAVVVIDSDSAPVLFARLLSLLVLARRRPRISRLAVDIKLQCTQTESRIVSK